MDNGSASKSRREKGEGTVFYSQTYGYWMCRVPAGVGPNGALRYVTRSNFPTEKAAEKARKQLLREIQSRQRSDWDTKTISELMDWYLIMKKGTIKPTSYDRLETTISSQVLPYIGDYQIQAAQPVDYKRYIDLLVAEGKAFSTVKKAYYAINGAFDKAIQAHHLHSNPLESVDLPTQKNFEKKEIQYFKPEEIPLIYDAARATFENGHRVYRLGEVIIFTINTGLRVGEVLGLKWENVNFARRRITICDSLVYVKERRPDQKTHYTYVEQHSTKTDAGYRVLAINDDAYKSLIYLKSISHSKYVVSTEDGNHYTARNLSKLLVQIMKRAMIQKNYGFHSLRHTFATLLFAAGEEIKTISALMGHSSVQVTQDIYIHVFEELQVSAINKIINFTAPIPQDIQDIAPGATLYIPDRATHSIKTVTLVSVTGEMAIVSGHTGVSSVEEALNACALETKTNRSASLQVYPVDQCFADLDTAKAMLG